MERRACILKASYGEPSSRIYWYEVDPEDEEKDESMAVLYNTPKSEMERGKLPISKIEFVPNSLVDWSSGVPKLSQRRKQIV